MTNQRHSHEAPPPEGKRIAVIGAVAAGMSAASQVRRRAPDSQVVVFERGIHVSYGACGMPYNIMDPERPMEDLVVVSPERFRTERGIDLRTESEVLAIDTAAKSLRVRDTASGREYEHAYDELIIATGASAIVPPIAGMGLDGVFLLRQLKDGLAIKQFLADSNAKKAVIVGAGYIGLEMAEALRERSVSVTMIERLKQVIPGFDPKIAEVVARELAEHDVEVKTGVSVLSIQKNKESGLLVQTDAGSFQADVVLVAVGVRPNVSLAKEAGIKLGPTGAIAVNDQMHTSAAGVFAAGDCAQARHLVSNRPAYIPLGTTANKQGKVAGANAAGGDERFGGIVGTAGFKVFELEVARTGLGQKEIDALELEVITAPSKHGSRGHGYPGSETLFTVLFAERGSGRLLGAQMAGKGPVAGRVNVFATALHAGMSVDAIEALDLVYAPPLAPVYDAVAIAAMVARKGVEKDRV